MLRAHSNFHRPRACRPCLIFTTTSSRKTYDFVFYKTLRLKCCCFLNENMLCFEFVKFSSSFFTQERSQDGLDTDGINRGSSSWSNRKSTFKHLTILLQIFIFHFSKPNFPWICLKCSRVGVIFHSSHLPRGRHEQMTCQKCQWKMYSNKYKHV